MVESWRAGGEAADLEDPLAELHKVVLKLHDICVSNESWLSHAMQVERRPI